MVRIFLVKNRTNCRNKHSLSLSPLKNTLASSINKYKSGDLSKIPKYKNSDSTQGSLNLDAYMMNSSTLTIEEVDEDENKDPVPLLPKVNIPNKILPSLNHNPKLPELNKPTEKKQKVGLIFGHKI